MGSGNTAMASLALSTIERVERSWSRVGATTRRASVAAGLAVGGLAAALSVDWSVRVAFAITGALLVAAALVDLHEHRLPNTLVAAAFATSVIGAAATLDLVSLAGSLGGTLVAGGAMLAVRLTRGVGMGDVKLAGAIGASVGSLSFPAAPLAIAVAAIVAATFGLATGRRRVPLGPALWLGWAVSAAALVAFEWGWPA